MTVRAGEILPRADRYLENLAYCDLAAAFGSSLITIEQFRRSLLELGYTSEDADRLALVAAGDRLAPGADPAGGDSSAW